MEQMAMRLNQHLKTGGHWLFADFEPNKNSLWWAKKILLPLMYLFFIFVSKIPAKHTPNYQAFFEANQFEELASKSFWGELIVSRIYRKR